MDIALTRYHSRSITYFVPSIQVSPIGVHLSVYSAHAVYPLGTQSLQTFSSCSLSPCYSIKHPAHAVCYSSSVHVSLTHSDITLPVPMEKKLVLNVTNTVLHTNI